ncbi:MAG: glucuronate isomerase [Planctomycetia bacterium]|nr:glucuronate isomerase [Planctomycetia bacterium]
MTQFITDNFLLETKSAERLYFEYAETMPIIDYHCHLSSLEVATNRQFDNITQIWLGGDHYKWRAMRAAGIHEKFITGDAPDREKFNAWADVVPQTIRSPLFHWTMLELNRPFGINDRFLNPGTADSIWSICNEILMNPLFHARGIMEQMRVKLVCTTDDPVDDLKFHRQIADENQTGTFSVKVIPAFRPDKVLPWACTAPEGIVSWKAYIEKLGIAANAEINSFAALRAALLSRHDYFHQNGCRISDHGFGLFQWTEKGSDTEKEAIFARILNDQTISPEDALILSSSLLTDIAVANAEKNWTMQLHIGALRNNSTRIFNTLGPDAGCDSIIDGPFAVPLSRFLDRLDREEKLPKTIVYNLNPDSNYMLAALIANFNDGSYPGKMQYGSGWWFLDQKNGMEDQINTLSNTGLLGRFVGMLTDSRSFLSYTRHEYFRRILCNMLGNDMEKGLIPNDFDWIGKMVQDISYNNAKEYFGFELN